MDEIDIREVWKEDIPRAIGDVCPNCGSTICYFLGATSPETLDPKCPECGWVPQSCKESAK